MNTNSPTHEERVVVLFASVCYDVDQETKPDKITNYADLGQYTFKPGGPTRFLGETLLKLNPDLRVIAYTSGPDNNPNYQPLRDLGMEIYSFNNDRITFDNTYITQPDGSSRREQQCLSETEKQTVAHLHAIGHEIPEDAIVIAAPLMNEISAELIQEITDPARRNIFSSIPQGFFRRSKHLLDNNASVTDPESFFVYKTRSEEALLAAKHGDVVVSVEDLEDLSNEERIEFLRASESTILTRGDQGCVLIEKDEKGEVKMQSFEAFALTKDHHTLLASETIDKGRKDQANTGLGEKYYGAYQSGRLRGLSKQAAIGLASVYATATIENALEGNSNTTLTFDELHRQFSSETQQQRIGEYLNLPQFSTLETSQRMLLEDLVGYRRQGMVEGNKHYNYGKER